MAAGPDNFGLIIGAMKSGTTSLYRYLVQHPEIAACRSKEPNFFACDENWAKGMEWYRSLWKWKPKQHKIALEATSFYTKRPYYPQVPERIAEVRDAQFRFIYIMRHPLERLESHDLHTALRDGATPLDVAIPQNAIWASQYAMQLDAYQGFGRERMLLLFTDDLKRNPLGVVQTACRFLGVDPDYRFGSLGEVHNPRRRHAEELRAFWRRIDRIGFLNKLVRKLPEETRERLRIRLSRCVDVDESKYRLSAEQREFVLQQLGPDLQRLRDHYGVDVESRWGIQLPQTSQPSPSVHPEV